jgi:two-component system response regulator CpxR
MQPVLMVDDDTELCEMVAEYLEPEGFQVTALHDGETAIEVVRGGAYSLVLLDVMLPRLNGFEVLRRIRSGGNAMAGVPVLMLTARGDAVDRIVGLEVGADDYLPKPFDERELVARMRAILRRTSTRTEAAAETPAPAAVPREHVTVADVTMDMGARVVRANGETVILTAAEFDLLALLLRAAGNVVGRDRIAQDVLDRDLLPFDRSIDTHVSHLRRKLGPYADGAERIKTVRGVGYIYVLPTG